jgi:hypothetical protein
MMNGGAPGRCADCGADAYIQLALPDEMLCAHCYQDRPGIKKKTGRKGGEHLIAQASNTIPFRPRPS